MQKYHHKKIKDGRETYIPLTTAMYDKAIIRNSDNKAIIRNN